MRSSFHSHHRAAILCALALVAGGGCTQVQVEETRAEFNNLSCRNDSGGNGGMSSGGGTQQSTTAQMDTYIVQIFELNEGEGTSGNDCNTCLATRANCFFEKSACVCGDLVDVSPARLPEMLKGLHVPVPAKYGSLYCMRIMAVQRSSQSEQCQCDPSWEAPDKVRLCAASPPYAASSLPIGLDVQCSNNRAFSTCLGQTSP